MKHLFAIFSAMIVLAFAVPAFACDGHKKADKTTDGTVTSTGGETDEAHTCSADCSCKGKTKKEKSKSEEGEV